MFEGEGAPAGSGGAEDTLDQQLEALLGSGAPAPESGKGASPNPDKAQPPAASPAAASQTLGPDGKPVAVPDTADPLLTALDGIKDETPAADDKSKPQLSEEHQQILRVIPSAEAAVNLHRVAENYTNFSTAFEQGRFDEVETMFKNWNSDAYDRFLENIYAKHVASGEWVDRFIDEHDGTGGKTHKTIRALEQKIASVQTQLREKDQTAEQQRASAAQQQAFTAYNTHVHSLLEQIKFNPNDRTWVVAALNARVANDPQILTEIRNGNVNAVNSLFKTTIREYVLRDKQVNDTEAAKIAAQGHKQAPIGGGAATETALPDDIRQVPKGQEDSWMDQQLGKLARLVGRK